ncbi:hypothetical protein ARMSODRAFT_980808 [Armillaria solidipes]|uniref:Uncharacterized protein n=1 Tax=Armillaria solidipes TaxID=1076256 RepID=A0A2H3B8H8_9AGAR|nr:hypothetical protein ARMSODRAFT_980808 [Armillaria solidipes]
MSSDNPSVEVKTEESASSSNQTERTPAPLSLAEQDHLFQTLVVPQRLPELCFSNGNRCTLLWDLPCEYQGSIQPHYCEHYRALHYVTHVRKHVNQLKATLEWTTECMYCGALTVSQHAKENGYMIWQNSCLLCRILQYRVEPEQVPVGTEAVGTVRTPAHGPSKPSAKTGEEGVGNWGVATRGYKPITMASGRFLNNHNMETLTHTVAGSGAMAAGKKAHLQLVRMEKKAEASLYLKAGPFKEEDSENNGCHTWVVPMALPGYLVDPPVPSTAYYICSWFFTS